MFALVILTFFIMALAFFLRRKAVIEKQLKLSYFRTMTGGSPPEQVVKTGRQFSNLFEVPVLFYIVSVLAIVQNKESLWMLVLGWCFVLVRTGQAIVHLTYNNVLHRSALFFTGNLLVLGMWVIQVFF